MISDVSACSADTCVSDEPLDFFQVPAQDGDIQIFAMRFDDVEARKRAVREGEGDLYPVNNLWWRLAVCFHAAVRL